MVKLDKQTANTVFASAVLVGASLSALGDHVDLHNPSASTCDLFCEGTAWGSDFVWCCEEEDTCGNVSGFSNNPQGCCNLPGGGNDCGSAIPEA